MGDTKTARLGYCDALRCLAALAVVLIHCAGATLGQEAPDTTRFLILNLFNGAARWAVPMFLMLSGAFLLDPQRPMPVKKWLGYLSRMGIAVLLWGFFYAFYDARGAHIGLEWFLEALIRMVKGELHFHLWYLPMLMGLYLLLPLARALVRGASRRELWYAVGLWGSVTLGLNVLYQFFPGALGHPWLNMLGLYYLSTYMGYFLLGYLLKTCQLTPRRAWVCYGLGLLGLVVTCAGSRLLSQAAGTLDGRLYEIMTPNTCAMAVALFVGARRLELGKHPIWARLSPLAFGVYLLHPFVLHVCQAVGLPDPAWNVAWAVPLEALAVFAFCLAVSWALRRLPAVGKYIC